MNNDEKTVSPARRRMLRQLSLLPFSAGAFALPAKEAGKPPDPAAPIPAVYEPTYFSAAEWAFVQAACDRLIPADDVGPSAAEAGVPEFLDRHMQTPYAAGDIWYMQGPFVEAPPQFGYQGRLPVREILRVGIRAFDAHCQRTFDGKRFSQLDHVQQEALLKAAETGGLEFENISAREFFNQLLAETRMGYFCDPRHGGNKNMAAWKMIGYPGARADYADWVEVRNRAYPLAPVDLAGKRG